MREIKTSRFLPRWKEVYGAEGTEFQDMPDVGGPVEPPARIPARVIPKDGWDRVTFQTLGDIVQATQHIVFSVAHEVIRGIDLAFSDLRKIDLQVTQFAKLYAEPLQGGSLVIPAELGEDQFQIDGKSVNPQDVVDRFSEVMRGVAREGPAFRTTLAVLRSIEELDKVLKRDVQRIEYAPSVGGDSVDRPEVLVVDPAYILEVTSARKARVSRRKQFGDIECEVGAVDRIDKTFRVILDGGGTMKGKFPEALKPRIAALLGRRVKVFGDIVYLKDVPRSIELTHIESLD